MATITKTTNYDLTIYNGAELPSFLTDISVDNVKIDSALKAIDNKVEYTNELVEQVAENTADIETLEGKVETLETQVAILQPEVVDNLQRRVGICETDINANAELIEALTTRVADDEDNLAQHAIRIGNLETRADATAIELSDLTAEVRSDNTTLSGRLDLVEADVSTLGTNVSNLSDKVTDLDSDVDGVHVDIQTNATNIETLGTQVSNLQTRMTTTEAAVIAIDQKFTQMYTYTGTADVSDDNKVGDVETVTGGHLTAATIKGMTAYSAEGYVLIPYINNGYVYLYSPSTIATDFSATVTCW